MIFLEQIDGYSSALSGYIIATGLRHVKVLVTLIPFSRSYAAGLYKGYHLNLWMDFLRSYIAVPLGQA